MSEQKRKKQPKEKQRKNRRGNTAASLCGQGQVGEVSKQKPVFLKPPADLAKPFSWTSDSQGVTVKVSAKGFF